MKLHELLAVESSLETQAKTCAGQLAGTFEKKRHLFEEKRVVFTPSAEGQPPVVESQSDIQTTVPSELKWLTGFLAKSYDASLRVADANTRASADILLDNGVMLAPSVPATALLELEKRIAEVIVVIKAIPTLDPAKGFKSDEDKGRDIFRARDVVKTRTQKQKKVFVKYEATPQHPAQTELLDQDVPIGTLCENEWSSLITPAQKADMLTRAEEVGRAVRQARSRANEVEINRTLKIGDALLNYIIAQ